MANDTKDEKVIQRGISAYPSLWSEVEAFQAWKRQTDGVPVSFSAAAAWLMADRLKQWREADNG
jgi:hypothetical protein